MSRDPSGIYTYPVGTPGVPGTTILSARYNAFLDDLALTLNTALPINMGGTSASTPAAARTALATEVNMQTVTNYDTHIFESGSFNSSPGATNAPAAGAYFYGTAISSGGATVEIECVNLSDGLTPHTLYRRSKNGGVWGAWAIAQSNQFLSKTVSDTTVGNLTIAKSVAQLTLNDPAAAPLNQIAGQSNGVNRWAVRLGDGGAGADFAIRRFNDAGAALDNPLTISRANGAATFNTLVTINNGGIIANGGSQINAINPGGFGLTVINATTPTGHALMVRPGADNNMGLAVQNAAATLNVHSLTGNGNYACTGGITAAGAVQGQMLFVMGSATDGRIYFYHGGGATQKGAIVYDSGDNFYLMQTGTGNQVGVGSSGNAFTNKGYNCKAGTAAPSVPSNAFNINFTGSAQLWIDATNQGTFAYTSDYRTKKDVTNLGSMWKTIRALRPISYTQAEWQPPSSTSAEPMYQADDTERWGFVAHELQDTMIPSAASGVKDDPVCVQSPNPWTVIAALTKALQEAMARIEAVEELAHPR